jgi:hypothetical protein
MKIAPKPGLFTDGTSTPQRVLGTILIKYAFVKASRKRSVVGPSMFWAPI